MKKLTYIAAAIFMVSLTGCHRSADYDTYVETLKGQPAVIDTISSPQSYAAYLDCLDAAAHEFDAKGIKLDDAQKEQIAVLGAEIQNALTAKYNELAQTPMALPDDIPVESTDSIAGN